MKRKITVLLSALLALLSCDDSNNETPAPASVKIFTFHATADFVSSSSDNWIIIHNSAGELIDYKPFESGETLVFETDKEITDNKLTITLFDHHFANNTTHVYDLKSYHGIDIEDEWTISKPATSSPTSKNVIGSFSFSLTGEKLQDVNMTDKRTRSFFGMGGGSSYSGSSEIYDDSEGFLITALDNGHPRYKFLQDVKDQDHYNLNFQEMDEFDKTVTVPVPQYNRIFLLIEGREEDQGYNDPSYLTAFTNGSKGSSIIATYLDRLSKYKTYLLLWYEEKDYYYFNQGTIPATISLPFDAEFSITNKTVSNFSYTHTQPFAYRTTSWTLRDDANTEVFDWDVNAPDGDYKTGSLPDELLRMYPYLKPENMVYITTSFTTSGQSYSELIESGYKGKAKEILELYSVRL